jgi:hypothetical protein
MFPRRYFPASFFAPRYWPGELLIVVVPGVGQACISDRSARATVSHTAARAIVSTEGVEC